MDALANRLARVQRIARAMNPDAKPVHEALPAVRDLLDAAHVRYLLVGGLAVVHHGYVRTTEDIDVLVEKDAFARIAPLLAARGFERLGMTERVRHVATGVRVDLLVEGRIIPRPDAVPFPPPDPSRASSNDPTVAGLPLLVELKLRAHRHQDLADVVALLKHLDEGAYLQLEVSTPRELRSMLARLRDDALDELRYSRDE
jgi:hypothetical protein